MARSDGRVLQGVSEAGFLRCFEFSRRWRLILIVILILVAYLPLIFLPSLWFFLLY